MLREHLHDVILIQNIYLNYNLNLANQTHREKIKKKIREGNYKNVVYVISGFDRSHYARLNYNAEKDLGVSMFQYNKSIAMYKYLNKS